MPCRLKDLGASTAGRKVDLQARLLDLEMGHKLTDEPGQLLKLHPLPPGSELNNADTSARSRQGPGRTHLRGSKQARQKGVRQHAARVMVHKDAAPAAVRGCRRQNFVSNNMQVRLLPSAEPGGRLRHWLH